MVTAIVSPWVGSLPVRQVGEVGRVLAQEAGQGRVVVVGLVDDGEGGDDTEDQSQDGEDAEYPVGLGPAQHDGQDGEPQEPHPEVEGDGELVGNQVEHDDGQSGEGGQDEANRNADDQLALPGPVVPPDREDHRHHGHDDYCRREPSRDQIDIDGEGAHGIECLS
jgi:hypothetical protein